VLPVCGCGGGADDIQLEVIRDGDRVTFDWDGRAVHEVAVSEEPDPPQTAWKGVWRASYSEENRDTAPRAEPTVVPPIHYGEPVDGAFSSEPIPLVPGKTYNVEVLVYGWKETCDERGITDADDPPTEGIACNIAFGRVKLTY
jgi:hypothetical protein